MVSVADFHEPDTPLCKKTSSSPTTLLPPKYMRLHIKASSIDFTLPKFMEILHQLCWALWWSHQRHTKLRDGHNHTRNAQLLSMSLSQTETHSCCFLLQGSNTLLWRDPSSTLTLICCRKQTTTLCTSSQGFSNRIETQAA